MMPPVCRLISEITSKFFWKNRRWTFLRAGMRSHCLSASPGDAEFLVFGVVTEYCVRLAAKGLLERGRAVSIVEDAIETLNVEEGRRTVAELKQLGAKFITTEQAVAALSRNSQSSR